MAGGPKMGLHAPPFEPEFECHWVENSCLARRRCCAYTFHRLSEAEHLGRIERQSTTARVCTGFFWTVSRKESKLEGCFDGVCLMGTNQENNNTLSLSSSLISLSGGNISERPMRG
jgi:hypothetical protein